MSSVLDESYPAQESFRHEALFYAGEDEFVEETVSFVREGMDAGEPVLVAVALQKIDLIRSALGPVAGDVLFADMAEVGRNPARIIPLWREFVDAHSAPGCSVRGIGEPIWATRTAEETVESHRHEALLNLAFAGEPAFLLCPYDTASLEQSVLQEARQSHPVVIEGGEAANSASCLGPQEWAAPFDRPLSEVPEGAISIPVTEGSLAQVRGLVFREAVLSGLEPSRADDMVIAVNEVATNSIRHGGGRGTLMLWSDGSSIICEVRDEAGRDETEPLLGRERPKATQEGGFGLWLVNQLCDLVQFRNFSSGSVARLYMRRP